MSTHSQSSRRIGAFYFFWFTGLGVFLPYAGVWYRSLGFGDAQVGWLMALLPAMSLLTPPIIGVLADARRARPFLLRIATAATMLTALALVLVTPRWTFAGVVVVVGLFALARSPVGSLTDATAAEVMSADGRPGEWGRLRRWGSLGFLIAAAASGPLFDRFGPSVIKGTAVGLVAAAMLSWGLPAPRLERRPDALSSASRLLRERGMALFLASVAVVMIACGAYDGGYSLHVRRIGLPSSFAGYAWAVGVGAEVIVLTHGGFFLSRFSAARLVAASAVVAAVRWAGIAWLSPSSTSGPVASWGVAAALMALQPLHGITFGLWYSACVQVMHRRGRHVPTAAQGLLAAAYALGSMIGMVGAGSLLGAAGGRAMFGVAALVALVGAALAFGYARMEERGLDEEAEAGPLTTRRAAVG